MDRRKYKIDREKLRKENMTYVFVPRSQNIVPNSSAMMTVKSNLTAV